MSNSSLTLALAALTVFLASSTVRGMPDADSAKESELFSRVVETKRTAPKHYAEVRRERLEKLNQTAALHSERTEGLPGWKLEKKSEAPAEEAGNDRLGVVIIILAGAGVVLSLLLRILAPWLYHRPAKQVPEGPMTVTLRPREERNLSRHGPDTIRSCTTPRSPS